MQSIRNTIQPCLLKESWPEVQTNLCFQWVGIEVYDRFMQHAKCFRSTRQIAAEEALSLSLVVDI